MLRRSPFRLTFACALVLALAPASPALAAMSRSVVMQRAEQWVSQPIPYSQVGWADINGVTVSSSARGWRRDCSGFVSMSWNLFKPGASTRTLHLFSDPITKAALQPGDAMVSYDNHTLLFGGWADEAHSTYYAYEMSSSASRNSTPTPDGTITRITPYPYWNNNQTYKPYRLRGISDNIDYTAYTTAVEGPNRYATAIAASQAAFAAGDARVAIVASGENWPDALGASALAGAVGGPVLLTKPDALPGAVAAELARLGTTEAIVVGGTGAVRANVAAALDALSGVSVTRIGGANRYETARLIAVATAARVRDAGGTPDTGVFIATGANFPDALAASPIAYAKARPILLTPSAGLSGEAASAMAALGTTDAIILGGTGPVSSEVASRVAETLGDGRVLRLAGADRYASGLAIARYGHDECDLTYAGAGVATGASFPDALAGGAMAGKLGTVLLLTPAAKLDGNVAELILANRAEFGKPHCLGGLAALKPIVRESIACMLSDS